MEQEQIKQLLKKYTEGKCTETEKALLESWYLQFNEHEADLFPSRISTIKKRVARELPGNEHLFLRGGFKLAAAAVVIGVILTAGLLFLRTERKQAQQLSASDVPAGSPNAILTLSDGRRIDLQATSIGVLRNTTGIAIEKINSGQIRYAGGLQTTAVSAALTNSISVPNAGHWQVTLPDGTRVWLNAASTLTYPASFAGQKNRQVQLSGEAYFEVAKDERHPFIVSTKGQTVEVLGTHFNIHAYADETSVRTALTEGRVRLTLPDGKTRTLSPDEEAVTDGCRLLIRQGDMEEALAWKNGYFRFNDESIQSIMRQLARWYDLEVIYAQDIMNTGLNGKISRNKPISQVLKALEATQTVHFKVQGRRITVMK